MKNTPKVSIIIPTYNHEKYIERCITSAINQTYKNKEIVVIDDFSTDNTEKFLKKYNGKIRLIRNENNKGSNYSRNKGARIASGEYLSFLDSDDFFFPKKIENQMKLFKNPSVIFTGTRFKIKDGDKISKSRSQYSGDISRKIYRNNFIGGFSSLVVNKKEFISCGLCDESLESSQDWDLYIRLSKKGDYDYVDKPLFVYTLHKKNVRRDPQKLWDGRARLFNKIKYDIPSRKWKSELRTYSAEYHPNWDNQKKAEELKISFVEYPLNIRAIFYLIRRVLRGRSQ